jgi:hypothetical protein
MSTRKTAWQSLTFDHGCQFFHAQSADMRNVVRDWVEAGEQPGQLPSGRSLPPSHNRLVAGLHPLSMDMALQEVHPCPVPTGVLRDVFLSTSLAAEGCSRAMFGQLPSMLH